MAMTAIDKSDRAMETHTRALLPPFSSRLSVSLSPDVSASVCVASAVSVRECASHPVAVLSLFAASTFARLSLRLLASCLSRMRADSGGVPVVLSGGCDVSKISVTRSVASSLVSTLCSHAVSSSFRSRSVLIAALSSRWLSAVAVCDSDECVCSRCSCIVFFGAAQLVADRAVVSVRARIDFFNSIREGVYFFLQLNHILAQRLDHQFHNHLYGLFVVVEFSPAHVGEGLFHLGAEFVYFRVVLGAQEYGRQQCRERRGDDRHRCGKDCFSHWSLLFYSDFFKPCGHVETRTGFHKLERLYHAVPVEVG